MQDIGPTGVSAWRLQLKKGTLELAVLALLRAKPAYGLELLESLNQIGLEVSDGTIYPLLSRLRNEGKVTTEWVEEQTGHAHKYYTLTPSGRRFLDLMISAWRDHHAAISNAIAKSNTGKTK